MRVQDNYPDLFQIVEDFSKGEGDTLKFQRDIFDGGGYTKADRKLNGSQTISTTGQVIRQEEVPIVLEEYHGPYNSTGSAVLPYSIKSFDARFRANKEQLGSITGRHLGRDYVKWLDTVLRDELRSTSNITYSDTVTNVLSFTSGAGHIANLEMLLAAKKALSDREWRKFPNGRYLAVVPTKFNTDMVSDPDYRDMVKAHGEGRNPVFGYIGSVQDIDIVECSTLKTYAAGVTVPNDGQVVPTSVTVQEGLLLGPGAVGFGTALPPELRWADDSNYQTLAKCIWYAVHAFATLDTRAVQRMLWQ